MPMNLAMDPLSMQLHVHQQMLYQQHQMALHHYQQGELSFLSIFAGCNLRQIGHRLGSFWG